MTGDLKCFMCRREFGSFERIHFVRHTEITGPGFHRVAFCLECCADTHGYPIALRQNPLVHEKCPICGGAPSGDIGLNRVKLNCPHCTVELTLRPVDIDPVLGTDTACPGCNKPVYIAPSAICGTCNRWLSKNWGSAVSKDKLRERRTGLTDNGNATVTDYATGLVWQKQDDGEKRSYQDAIAYCEALSLAEHWDWRLPTLEELRTLGQQAGTRAGASISIRRERYWTRSPWPSQDNVGYTVDFGYQLPEDVTYDKKYSFYVLAVRRP